MTVHTDTGTRTDARGRAVVARAAALLVAGFFGSTPSLISSG